MVKDHFKPVRAVVLVMASLFGTASIIDFYRLSHSNHLSELEIIVTVTVGFFYALYIPRFFLFLSLPTVSIDDELFFEIKDEGKFLTYLQIAHYGSFNVFEVRVYIEEIDFPNNSFVKEIMNTTISQLPSRKNLDYSKTKLLIKDYDHRHWRKTDNRMRVTVSFVTRLFNVKGFETKIIYPEKSNPQK